MLILQNHVLLWKISEPLSQILSINHAQWVSLLGSHRWTLAIRNQDQGEGGLRERRRMADKRPNRSDVHLSEKEETRIEEETRDYFDGLAPERHTKPQRSEYSAQYTDTLGESSDVIPEFVKFQQLENDPQKLVYKRSDATEEFVETEYYKDLNCVDKQHHTTGTGFIGTEKSNGSCFKLEPDTCSACHSSSKGNPATNDWIPATGDMATLRSDKPSRSDI